jgi:hypothetical protein
VRDRSRSPTSSHQHLYFAEANWALLDVPASTACNFIQEPNARAPA